jgi:hypothetical protein
MSNVNQVRAAVLLLNTPVTPPPPASIRQGLFGPEQDNPEFLAWCQNIIERCRALCVLEEIPLTESGDINWMGLAIRLAFKYEPKIRIRRKAGAPRKNDTPAVIEARKKLAELVELKRAKNPRQSVRSIAENLTNRELPHAFRHLKPETLRKQVALAARQVALDRAFQKTISELFKPQELPKPYSPFSAGTPGTHFVDGEPGGLFGLSLRASTPPGKLG